VAYHQRVEALMSTTGARVLAAVMLAAMVVSAALPVAAQSPGTLGYVTRVVEGDTIYAEVAGRIEVVRYLGVNAPVVDHPVHGREFYAGVVREMNRRLVEGKWIRLAYEATPRDEHGGLLAYVWVGTTFVNAALVYAGYAEAAASAADVRYAAYFRSLDEDARRQGRGLWAYGDVLAYYRPRGSDGAAGGEHRERAATAEGGRVFSAPAPFIPAEQPGAPSSPESSTATAAPSARSAGPGGTTYMPAPRRGR
jgi:micrococcal nuclease